MELFTKKTLERSRMQANCPTPQFTNLSDDAGIDLFKQYTNHNTQRCGIGVTPPQDFSMLPTTRCNCPIDRFAAPVNEDRPHPYRFHENHIEERGSQCLDIFHDATAQLDDCQPIAKGADVAEGLDKHLSLANGIIHRDAPSLQKRSS